jgi:hypothetical protein
MDIQEADVISDSAKSILSDIVDTLKCLKEVQGEIVKRMSNQSMISDDVGTPSQGAEGKKIAYSSVVQGEKTLRVPQTSHTRRLPSGGLVPIALDRNGKPLNVSSKPQKPEETPEEEKKRKFAEAIKEAERSTLCFNLDMGNVPLQNKVTIQEKASLALTTMAAKKEDKSSSIPSKDAIAAIDDLTSMVTSMELFGANTKQYKGNTDKPFCTVPVKYQFKDRDVRTFAEKTLRDTCGVHCSTPYPTMVRETIKQVVNHVKSLHPGDYVKVNVMTKEFGLKISRRPKGKDLPWYTYPDLVPLPEIALEISLRKVPEGFKITDFPIEPDPDEEMPESPVRTEKSPEKKDKTPPRVSLSSLLKNKK